MRSQVRLLSYERKAGNEWLPKRAEGVLVKRCEAAGVDPREVVTAVFDDMTQERCRSQYGSAVPPAWIFTTQTCLDIHRRWRADRIEMRLTGDPRVMDAPLVAEIRGSEYRIKLLVEQGVPADDAIRVGIMAAVIRPLWLLLNPDRVPADVSLETDYNQADLEALVALSARQEKDPAFAVTLRRAMERA